MKNNQESEVKLLAKADREIVSEAVERLRVVYEKFIHEKQAQGYDFKYVDGLMIGHNFYKLILFHIAGESQTAKDILMRVAISTLLKVLDGKITKETDIDLH